MPQQRMIRSRAHRMPKPERWHEGSTGPHALAPTHGQSHFPVLVGHDYLSQTSEDCSCPKEAPLGGYFDDPQCRATPHHGGFMLCEPDAYPGLLKGNLSRYVPAVNAILGNGRAYRGGPLCLPGLRIDDAIAFVGFGYVSRNRQSQGLARPTPRNISYLRLLGFDPRDVARPSGSNLSEELSDDTR
jgi:hypothetical protein